MNSVIRMNDIFSEAQLGRITKAFDTSKNIERQERYGRYMFHDVMLDDEIQGTITHLVKDILGEEIYFSGAGCAEYTPSAGHPNLPPHFDGDDTDYIVDFQLSSNTSWGLGVDLESYTIEDNCAIMFDPNEHIHWRPHSDFKEDGFVRMVFFRFKRPYVVMHDDKRLDQNHPIFDPVKAYRDSL